MILLALLKPLNKEDLSEDLQNQWDLYEKEEPTFRNLWGTQAHSPTIFKHIWQNLLNFKKDSPVSQHHFELTILVTSNLATCNYCVSHHSPRAIKQGFTEKQLNLILGIRLNKESCWEDNDAFNKDDNLVIALAYHLVWSGIYAQAHNIHPRVIFHERNKIHDRLISSFSPQQIEELVWRTTQCIAFNWHNDFLEIDIEPSVIPVLNKPEIL